MAIVIDAPRVKNCGDCIGYYRCKGWTDEPYSCPIIGEIPDKHGDLKDVSILLHYLAHMHGATEHDNALLREFEKMIRECPTIVEATE